MEELEVVAICKKVLDSLSEMGWENAVRKSDNRLIFPKIKEEEKYVKRISEQELRQLFIEEFNKNYEDLYYYSIETPTKAKYRFGKAGKKALDKLEKIEVNDEGQSALLDMCVFEKDNIENKYNRILNIEFKHGNAPLEAIAKDVLKLMYEQQNGAFIFLLDNTNSGSLNNTSKTRMGVLDKLSESFFKFKDEWEGNKSIQLVIISFDQETLIHRTVTDKDLKDPKKHIFSNNTPTGFGNITTVTQQNGWGIEPNK